MALHNLKITVINGGRAKTGDSFIQKGSKTPANDKLNNVNNDVEGEMQNRVVGGAKFTATTVAKIAAKTARQGINYYISDIGRKRGDSNYQDHVNRQLEIVGDIGDVLCGMSSGAVAGSSFGLVGTAIGAVAGAISSAIDLGFKYAERDRAYQHQMFQENTSQAHAVARANFQLTTGRMR